MTARRKLRVAAGLAAACILLAAAGTGAAAAPSGQARLAGSFAMSGVITRARSIPGEHAGEKVSRTWVFNPSCASGPCDRIQLIRGRGRGLSRVAVTLRLRSPGYYTGAGTFYAPLRCAGRVHRPGERVHYTVAVRVTGTELAGGQLVVSAVRATYASHRRDNLTPCVAVLGQADVARYRGQLTG